jgi:hypothetical protein
MSDKRPKNNDRGLIRVIKFSSAAGLGIMAAFLYSVKQVTPRLRYEFSFGTVISFLLGTILSWFFWRLVFDRPDGAAVNPPKFRKRGFIALSLLFAAATVTPFALSLKGVAKDKALEVVQGTAIAMLALGGIGFLLWQVARFLEADSKQNDASRDSAPEDK